jgi:ribosomal protein L6P/L9E
MQQITTIGLNIDIFLCLNIICSHFTYINKKGKISFFFSKLNQIECKLGFTHKKYIVVPTINHLDIVFRKPTLIVLSYNTNRLGNFIRTIKNAKKANAYSGRGFWDLKEQQNLKIIKKQ